MASFRECAANESADSTSSKNRMPHRPPPSTLCAPFYTAPRGTEGRTPSRQVRRPTAEVTWRGCASLRSSERERSYGNRYKDRSGRVVINGKARVGVYLPPDCNGSHK